MLLFWFAEHDKFPSFFQLKKAHFWDFRSFFNAQRHSEAPATDFCNLLDELLNLVYTVKNRFSANSHILFLSPIC